MLSLEAVLNPEGQEGEPAASALLHPPVTGMLGLYGRDEGIACLWLHIDPRAALFLAWQGADSDDQLDQLVSARIERQSIFQRPDPPSLWAVLDEGVLRRCIGSPKVMQDQLTHLLPLAVSDRSKNGYLRWRNAHVRHPTVLAAQRRERARVRSERQHRWGQPARRAA